MSGWRYDVTMQDDDDICLCFRVSKRKIVNFCKREKPVRVSLISECLSAGTGCGWCVPFIEKLYQQTQDGQANPDLPISPGEYASRRANYRQTGQRPDEATQAKDGDEQG